MQNPLSPTSAALAVVHDYHRRTKHRFEAYAAGPQALDWNAQPAPFRCFEGASVVPLPRLHCVGDRLAANSPSLAAALARPWPVGGGQPPQALALESLGALLQLSLGITAWKRYGPERWAVRANPSSGNLHPVEAYVLVRGFGGLADGVWHYRPDDHALELRAAWPARAGGGAPWLGVALSSVMWREAWKYGERAFRYCQLDTGHAAACLGIAAGLLGWTARAQPEVGHATLGRLIGVDRSEEFSYRRWVESGREEAELLLGVGLDGAAPVPVEVAEWAALAGDATWHGRGSLVDPLPLYRWPVIEAVAEATRRGDEVGLKAPSAPLPGPLPRGERGRVAAVPGGGGAGGGGEGGRSDDRGGEDDRGEDGGGEGRSARVQIEGSGEPRSPAWAVIMRRRSAQRFDPRHVMPGAAFVRMLAALLPGAAAPWGVLSEAGAMQPLLFVHRVEGFEPGLYLFERDALEAAVLLEAAGGRWQPERVAGLPAGIRLHRLVAVGSAELERAARAVHCHQDIAADSCLALGMVTRFAPRIEADPACYRDLLRAAGLLGQVLYLEAEAMGLRGTGIGCFFDDPVHALLGVDDERFQTLYHFTIGRPVEDSRIESTPAYPE